MFSNLAGHLFSFEVKEWFAIAIGYLIALAVFFLGFYLAFGLGQPANPILARLLKPLRWFGFLLMALAIAYAAFDTGRSRGAADCEAAWKAKNLEAQIAKLTQESKAKSAAASVVEAALEELKGKSEDDNQKIGNYREGVGRLSAALASCRAATADDDRRMRDLTGAGAGASGDPR